jgi:hypothetical protein
MQKTLFFRLKRAIKKPATTASRASKPTYRNTASRASNNCLCYSFMVKGKKLQEFPPFSLFFKNKTAICLFYQIDDQEYRKTPILMRTS